MKDDYKSFSKKMVIDRLIRDNKLDKGGLMGFGDGYVEIEEVKGVGGIAIGVASARCAAWRRCASRRRGCSCWRCRC